MIWLILGVVGLIVLLVALIAWAVACIGDMDSGT